MHSGLLTNPRGPLTAGLKTYCLQYLAMNPSSSLRVPCPICRSDYRIVPRGGSTDLAVTWRQLLRCTSTDRELLQRHCRYFLLVAPLLASTILAWRWMYECREHVQEGPMAPQACHAGSHA